MNLSILLLVSIAVGVASAEMFRVPVTPCCSLIFHILKIIFFLYIQVLLLIRIICCLLIKYRLLFFLA